MVLTQGAGESATGSLGFGIPTGMKLNRILLPCFQGTEVHDRLGLRRLTAAAAHRARAGTLTLTGSLTGSSLYATHQRGGADARTRRPIRSSSSARSSQRTRDHLQRLPDIPLSTITFLFNGTTQGSAFTTSCAHGTIPLSFTPQSGGTTRTMSGPMSTSAVRPPQQARRRGLLSGLANGRPKLHLRVVRSGHGPMLRSVAISLPSGLAFDRRALVTERICKHAGSSPSCRRTTAARGLSVSGATVNGEHLAGGALVISFERPTPNISLRAGGPLLVESASLQRESPPARGGTSGGAHPA